MHYPSTDVFVICFSVDSRDSLYNIRYVWLPELRPFIVNTPIVLVANKIDLRLTTDCKDQVLCLSVCLSVCLTVSLFTQIRFMLL